MNSEYFPEILRYFISKSKRIDQFLSDQIQGWMRDKVTSWLWDICEGSNYRIETFQLSIQIFSAFLSRQQTSRHTLQLIGIVSLMLAVKFHEKTTFSFNQACLCCSGRFTVESVQITEIYVLQKLEWRIDFPTASEISRSLLLATGVSYDLSKIFERSDAFAVICYLDFNLSKFTSLEIAITSIVCSLEQFNQLTFRNQWLNSVSNKINLDLQNIDNCKRGLVEKLFSTTPISDRNKIECLARDSISSLILKINKN